ncbi:hypothetical protein [Acinetobacter sp. ANC 3929]|uniref:hypothetical protein n=1 Tax=Acinetobacter sp. ANC 3929 TaxID=1217707 RepID=UPI0003A7D247|nr:hypothetical protein [Acinetobacter sp. ANC 3929]
MGIKYCQSCKKPMKSSDSECRTCGEKYKGSFFLPIAIIIALVVLLVGYGWWSYEQKQIEEENVLKAKISAYTIELGKLDIPNNDAQFIATLRYAEIKDLKKSDFSTLKTQVRAFEDQQKLTNNVMRLALAQPISELQKIKREVDQEKYSACLEAGRMLYSLSMGAFIEGMLTFLSNDKGADDKITYLFTKSIVQGKEANKVINECESRIPN